MSKIENKKTAIKILFFYLESEAIKNKVVFLVIYLFWCVCGFKTKRSIVFIIISKRE